MSHFGKEKVKPESLFFFCHVSWDKVFFEGSWMLKLVKPHWSCLLASIKLCYRQSGDEDTHTKQLKGRTCVPQLLSSTVSVRETEETTTAYENCPTYIIWQPPLPPAGCTHCWRMDRQGFIANCICWSNLLLCSLLSNMQTKSYQL